MLKTTRLRAQVGAQVSTRVAHDSAQVSERTGAWVHGASECARVHGCARLEGARLLD